MQTASTSQVSAHAAAVITHEVSNYDTWKAVFDEHASARKRAGILSAHVNRSLENPNLVTIYLAAGSAEAIRGFLSDPGTKSTMQRAGVIGAPMIATVTTVEDLTLKDRPLPAAIVMHKVAHFETWKTQFDAHGGARAKAGVIGHAVNRSTEDPNLVVVYVQANSIDQLRQFTTSEDLKSVMAKAGVQGAPQIAFVQGQNWGQ